MIPVKLTFFASLQNLFPDLIEVQLSEPTRLIQIFPTFSSKTGEGADEVFLEGESLKPEFIVLLNGRNVHALNGVFTLIEEACEISFFPLIGGGSN